MKNEIDKRKVFVSPEWVKRVIDNKEPESRNYIILEVAWGNQDESPEYNKHHIPGAIHVDIQSIEKELILNIKTPKEVNEALLQTGIDKDKVVILYGHDVLGTARVAYAYIWAGVENVKLLNGGLAAWLAAGYEVETNTNLPTPINDFKAKIPVNPHFLTSIEDAQKRLKEDNNFKLVSIRSYNEFTGKTSGYKYINKAGEPKGAVWGKAGSDPYHMEDYVKEDKTYINMDEMKELWKGLDFNLDNDLAFYCGTGWRASIPFLIMYENNYNNMSVYDVGWYQWQMNDELDVQLGDPNIDVVYTKVKNLDNDKAVK